MPSSKSSVIMAVVFVTSVWGAVRAETRPEVRLAQMVDGYQRVQVRIRQLMKAGDIALRRHRFPEARRCFLRVLKLHPGHPGARAGLARVSRYQARWQRAQSLLARARQAVKAGQHKAAANYYRQVLALVPNHGEARVGLRRYSPAGRAQSLLARARTSVKAGNYLAAAGDYGRILAIQPANPGARRDLGGLRPHLKPKDIITAVKRRDLDLVRAIVFLYPESRSLKFDYMLANRGMMHGYNPLLLACRVGHQATVEFLVKKGADVNAASAQGVTPLFAATVRGTPALVNFLIKRGANVNAAMGRYEIRGIPLDGMTILQYVAGQGRVDLARLLIARGANVNATDKNGRPPLYSAACHGFPRMVSLLIKKGAKVNCRNRWGRTPLGCALEWCPERGRGRRCAEVAKLLRQHGGTR